MKSANAGSANTSATASRRSPRSRKVWRATIGDDTLVPPDLFYVTYIKTTPEKVWEALTGNKATQKMFFGLKVESDWKTGSCWAFLSEGGSVHDEGEVLESERPRRLKLSWRLMFFEEARALAPAYITYDIEQVGEGVVKLTMTQHQPKPILRKFYEGGKQGMAAHRVDPEEYSGDRGEIQGRNEAAGVTKRGRRRP